MALETRYLPLVRCAHCTRHKRTALPIRFFHATSPSKQEEVDTALTEASKPLPPAAKVTSSDHLANTVHSPRSERRLIANHGVYPIGSRRRRAAIASSSNIPFHQLPYQCFQEARTFLQEDRKEKVTEIEEQRRRIEKLKSSIAQSGQEWSEPRRAQQEQRVRSMAQRLHELKILADINDPIVKKKFEDGMGDMNKPIYRHLADLQWRSYKRKVLVQRITQMNVVPDILPHVDPTVATSLAFGRRKVQHGEFVLSAVSEQAPTLNIQPFDKGDRWVTIAVVNPDVPNVAKDGFDYRCHFLASNIKISPTQTQVELATLDPETQIIQDWLPAYAQKGLPYQRMGIFVLEQEPLEQDDAIRKETRDLEGKLAQRYAEVSSSSETPATVETASNEVSKPTENASMSPIIPISDVKQRARYTVRDNFILRSFCGRYNLKPIGVDLFRTKWDEGAAGVMQRLGIAGWDVEFKRKRVEPLPYQRLKGERYR